MPLVLPRCSEVPRLCTDTKGTTRKGDFYMNRQFIMDVTAI